MNRRGPLRYLIVVWAMVETLLFGGLIYGWGSLVFILKDKHVYLDLCQHGDGLTTSTTERPLNVSGIMQVRASPIDGSVAGNATSSCVEQDTMFSLVFTVGSSLFPVGCAVLGQINFKFGTRVTRVILMLVFVSGTLMTAFVSRELPWLIFPGLTLLGIGGIPLLVTNMQVSNLFVRGSSIIVGLLCGAFDTSAGVQLVIKIAYENGFSVKHSYFILTGMYSMVIFSTFFFLPKGFISKSSTPSLEQEKLKIQQQQLSSIKLLKDLPSLRSCILSSSFLLHVLWFSVLQLRFNYFLSSLNPLLNKVLHQDQALVSYYTNVSMYMMMTGLVVSPFAGFVYDSQKGLFSNSRSALRRDLMPSVLPLMTCTALGFLVTVLYLIPSVQVLYITFITVTFFRSFLYCMCAAFLSAVFPIEYFGFLYGLMIITGGIFAFLQFALFHWAEAAGFQQVNYFLLALVLVSLAHPVYQWKRCRNAESMEITKSEKNSKLPTDEPCNITYVQHPLKSTIQT